ncbi:hypothetical protein V2J09_002037 [Rumex salicifolius]
MRGRSLNSSSSSRSEVLRFIQEQRSKEAKKAAATLAPTPFVNPPRYCTTKIIAQEAVPLSDDKLEEWIERQSVIQLYQSVIHEMSPVFSASHQLFPHTSIFCVKPKSSSFRILNLPVVKHSVSLPITCSAGGKSENGKELRGLAVGLLAAWAVAAASPVIAANQRLPPLSTEPNRCERAFVGNTIGQANGVYDKPIDLRFCDYTNEKSNLKGKSLAAALMSDAKFDGADMSEVVMSKAYAVGASFKGTDFTNAVIDRVNFGKADLHGAIFKNTVLSGSTFEDAQLQDVVFEDTIIGYIDLQKLCRNETINEDARVELGCRKKMWSDWQQLIQTVIIGLIFSFLVAKLISIVTAFKDENLSITRSQPAASPAARESDPDPGLLESVESLGDVSEVASRVSDDNSVMAEKGSVLSPDDNDALLDDDDDDDDWEGVESTELDEAFSAATAFVAASAADRLSQKVPNEVQLQLYGLYKIATEGPCSAPTPPAFKMTARAKWQAWNKLGAMPPEDAMQKYIEIVCELFPSWASGGTNKRRDEDTDTHNAVSSGPMGPVFSTYVHEEESGNELKMDAVHAFAREGDVDNLLKCIENGVSVDLKDSEGRTSLHWAVDRGHLNIIELLTSRNADVNAKDNEGQTPLHYAVVCDRENIAEFLIKHNADADIKDNDGESAVEICEKNWPWLRKQM